jgi:capsular exopolysaccharide synthesis family protein
VSSEDLQSEPTAGSQWAAFFETARVLRKHWLPIGFLTIAGIVAASFYSAGVTRVYRATTTIQIDPTPPKPLGQEVQNIVDVGAGVMANNREYYKTQYDILASRTLAEKTVKRLGLQLDGGFVTNLPSNAPVPVQPPPAPGPSMASPEDTARNSLMVRLGVAPVRDSRLVQITFDDADPERAKRVLRTLVSIYIDDNVDSVLASTNVAAEWLEEQLGKLKTELGDNEIALNQFKQTNQILSVSMDDQSNMLRDEMQQLNQALTLVRTEIEALSARNTQLQEVNITDPTELPSQELLQSSVLTGQRADYIRAKQQLVSLTQGGMGEQHPEVRAAASQVEISRQALLAEVSNIKEALSRQLATKKQEEKGLTGLFARAKARAMDLSRLGLEYNRLERAKVNTEKVYSLVLERSKESDLTRFMRFNNIRVVDEAYVDPAPVKPRTFLNTVVGGAVGLLLGFAAAFGRNSLDRTLKSAQDIEEHLELPLLGVLPRTSSDVSKANRKRGRRPDFGDELVVHEKPSSSAAEAARALRTNLMFAAPDRPQKSLVITSGGPFEGKTTVACWIAVAMAQAGKSVLLIDCDLRRPRLHKIFKRSNEAGVSTLLLEDTLPEDLNSKTQVPNLDMIPSGPGVPNPAELLQSERFEHFLRTLESRYDRIVIDTPPVNAVTDAAILSTRVNNTVLVARAHATSREAARHSIRTLADVGNKVLGVVLNAYDESRAGYGYGYGGYRYQYYYGNRGEARGPVA